MSADDWATWWTARGRHELSRLLWERWDPIGIQGRYKPPEDEYEYYVDGMGEMLRKGDQAEAIQSHLEGIENATPGLRPAEDRSAVAAEIVAWYESARPGPSADTCGRRPVGEGAYAYARGQSWLARGLAGRLEEDLTSERWNAWTLAEPTVPDERLQQFSTGGALCKGDAVRRGIFTEVSAAMAREDSAVWLLPDPMANEGDAYLQRARIDLAYFAVDGAVYHVERLRALERLRSAWNEVTSAAGQMGLVTTHDPSGEAPTRDALMRAAASATLFVISAYDGEGALFFARR